MDTINHATLGRFLSGWFDTHGPSSSAFRFLVLSSIIGVSYSVLFFPKTFPVFSVHQTWFFLMSTFYIAMMFASSPRFAGGKVYGTFGFVLDLSFLLTLFTLSDRSWNIFSGVLVFYVTLLRVVFPEQKWVAIFGFVACLLVRMSSDIRWGWYDVLWGGLGLSLLVVWPKHEPVRFLSFPNQHHHRKKSYLYAPSSLGTISDDVVVWMISHVQDPIVLLRPEDCVVQALNPSAESVFDNLNRGDVLTVIEQKRLHIHKVLSENSMDVPVRCEYKDGFLVGRLVPLNVGTQELWMVFLRYKNESEADNRQTKLAALGRLTANIAHEVRNPLTAIRQATDLLLEDQGQEEHMNDTDVRLLSLIRANCDRINRLIHEVLSLNRRDRIKQELIDLVDFWQDFSGQFFMQHPAAQKCVKLNKNAKKSQIWFDRGHLYQIFWNLMNNAWRHAEQDHPAISVTFRENHFRCYIDIEDNGFGVPEDIQAHIFEPFFTTESQGTGLGLYVARELAEANRGSLHHVPPSGCFSLTCYTYEI